MREQHRHFFLGMGAGGDPHRRVGATRRSERLHEGVGLHRCHVELEVAGHFHMLGRRAQRDEAAGVVTGLRRHQVHGAQRAPDQRCQHPIAAQ